MISTRTANRHLKKQNKTTLKKKNEISLYMWKYKGKINNTYFCYLRRGILKKKQELASAKNLGIWKLNKLPIKNSTSTYKKQSIKNSLNGLKKNQTLSLIYLLGKQYLKKKL